MDDTATREQTRTVTFEDPEDQKTYERAQRKFLIKAEKGDLSSSDFDEFESCKSALREAIQDAYAQAAGLDRLA